MLDSWTRFHILCALLQGPQYPYRIARQIAAETEGRTVLEAGNLHRRLQQMLAEGLITEVPAPRNETDGRRRYFGVTARGRAALRDETDRMREAVRTARSALSGGRAR